MRVFDKLTEIVFERQLVSVMNRTKWREIAQALTSNDEFNPQVSIRYLDGSTGGFSHLDWEWVKLGDTRVIEWLAIDPIRHQHVGRLLESIETNFSKWVREVLNRHAIPFVEADGLFHINGYLQPATR